MDDEGSHRRIAGMVRTAARTAIAGSPWSLAVPAAATELHMWHCLHGCPAGAPAMIGPTDERRWRADPVLAEAETLEPDDYRDANRVLGTDHGHQAPPASFTGKPHWEATNFLSNVAPQRSALNRGPWLGLEHPVRELAWSRDSAGDHVATGPLYEREMPPMPGADESHVVPSGYWKIVAILGAGGVRAAGFVFDQDIARGRALPRGAAGDGAGDRAADGTRLPPRPDAGPSGRHREETRKSANAAYWNEDILPSGCIS